MTYPIYYIGHSANKDDRFKASSGGVGTSIIKYLLESGQYGTSITYKYDRTDYRYHPNIIHSSEEMFPSGSIYQEIDLIRFVRDNISKIRNGIVLTCAPCQVKPIRAILNKNAIKNFIISYCCSGQTEAEGTWFVENCLGIDKKEVESLQYRGNGWPSGIQITLQDGTKVYRDNYTEPWKTMHQSWLFRPYKCFFCKLDTGRAADIALADPWLDEYKKKDGIGNTMFLVFTDAGKSVIDAMHSSKLIISRLSNYEEYAIAQAPNIHKEIFATEHKVYLKRLKRLISNQRYRNWAISSTKHVHIHMKIMRMLRRTESIKSINQSIMNIIKKVRGRLRRLHYSKKMHTDGSDFNVRGGGASINSCN